MGDMGCDAEPNRVEEPYVAFSGHVELIIIEGKPGAP